MCTTLNWEGLSRHRLVLLKTYGSDTAKKWKQFLFDLFSVSCGAKRAWLVDYFQPDAGKLQSVLADVLSREPNFNWNNICIVSINDDLLIVNIEDTLSVCEDLVQSTSVGDKARSGQTQQYFPSLCAGVCEFVVLGCSGNQHHATVDEFTHILKELLPIATVLKEKLLAFKCGSAAPNIVGLVDTMRVPHVGITVTEDVNLCTLFGWLLGYPFVYWFPYSNGGSEVGLSMVPLTCYKVCYIPINTATSPVPACDGMKMGMETLESHPLVLYSFSVPSNVSTINPLVSDIIHDWFRRIKDSTLKLLGVTVQLTTTSVTLPHVVL